ncbi:MAG: glycosyltransferase family 4 protein [Chloroflexota bacterium]
MKILVLAPQWPDPPRQGAAIRNLHILRYLARHHRVTLLTFRPDGPMEMSDVAAMCDYAEALPQPQRTARKRIMKLTTSRLPDMAWRLHSDAMHSRLEELCNDSYFDAVHVEGIEMVPYGLLALKLDPLAWMTYDAHNAEYLLQRRAFTTDMPHARQLPRGIYSLIQWWRLRQYERRTAVMSKHVLAVSPSDAAALSRLSLQLKDRVTLLPNGVDLDYWSYSAVTPEPSMVPEALVFDGTMDFRPNVDAVRWFASEVFPIVRAERPDAHFYIVGRNPAPEVLSLADTPGITVAGPVDDMRPWVAGAAVYVVPMRMGGGVRLKVLQAMSMERAIVATPMGAEGIAERPGQDMVVVKAADEFAASVVQLLGDPAQRELYGRSARELVTSRYSWDSLLPILDGIYRKDS